ncbi:MAG: polysaccharide biosynthesis protein [Acidobacteria bacterium]|nr:polysaccharide biosynthesis protein [Acidobacteriota bacterium]
MADVAILCAAFFVAYLPAVNIQIGEFYLQTALSQVPFVVLVQFSSLFLVGAYSILWRYVSIEDVKVFLKAALISGGILIAFRFLLIFSDFKLWQVPISVILIDTAFAFGGLLGLRVLRRFLYEVTEKNRPFAGRRKIKRKPALLVGAGRMGAMLAKEISGRADSELMILGFVDDDPRKKGGSVGGYKVLGTAGDLARLVGEMNVEQVVIAFDRAGGKEIRHLLEICRAIPVRAQIMPGLDEIATGRVSVNRLRDIEIEDLLGREPVTLDDQNLHVFLTNRVVMVTGAGGSIGSELVRQILTYRPKQILLVERAYRPEVIFHAAAHKHVPLMEQNAAEAIKNNVLATRCVALLAGEFGVRDFVLISTDKAVNPTSVMGASKRIAEIVVQDMNRACSTKYVAVRFGNVLGSAGSVVPIFREQIKKGEAVTVTDPQMTRYFMTIPEAAQLVLQAGALGEGGEILILDMGEPVRILDLAEDMIRLSGLTPYEDIDIVFTGVRQGEKLFEELEITGESLVKTRHPKIFVGKIATYSAADVANILDKFSAAVEACNEQQIRVLFNNVLPEAAISADKNLIAAESSDNAQTFYTPTTKLGLAEK